MRTNELTDIQYQALASRRQSHDTMLWQTPVISLTAQAFLFAVAFGTGPTAGRLLACLLAFVSTLASMHLLAKQRHLEVHFSRLLEEHERAKGWVCIHIAPPKPPGAVGWSAYSVWKWVLGTFGVVAIAAAIAAVHDTNNATAVPSKSSTSASPR